MAEKWVPLDYDPFADEGKGGEKWVPLDYDPFADPPAPKFRPGSQDPEGVYIRPTQPAPPVAGLGGEDQTRADPFGMAQQGMGVPGRAAPPQAYPRANVPLPPERPNTAAMQFEAETGMPPPSNAPAMQPPQPMTGGRPTPREDIVPNTEDDTISLGPQNAASGQAGRFKRDEIRSGPASETVEDRQKREGGAREEMDLRTHGRIINKLPTDLVSKTGPEMYEDKQRREAEARKNYEKELGERAEVFAESDERIAALKKRIAAGDPRAEAELNRIEYAQKNAAGPRAVAEAEAAAALQGIKTAGANPGTTQTPISRNVERVPATMAKLGNDSFTAAARIVLTPVRLAQRGFDVDKMIDENAQARDQFVNGWVNPDFVAAQDLGDKVVQGFASTLGFALSGMAGKALGLGATATTAVAGALPQAEQMYQEALKRGEVDGSAESRKWFAFVAGLGIGGTEALSMSRILHRLENLSGGGVTRAIGAATASGIEEGSQETLQKFLENLTERLLYGDAKSLDKDLAENALVGALSGAMMTGGAHAIHGLGNAPGNAVDRQIQPQLPPEVPPPVQLPTQMGGTMTGTMPPQGGPMQGTAQPAPQPPPVPPGAAPQAVVPPVPPKPGETGAPLPPEIIQADNNAQLLLGAGFTAEQIAGMSNAEAIHELEKAHALGVQPRPMTDEEMHTIFPFTAPQQQGGETREQLAARLQAEQDALDEQNRKPPRSEPQTFDEAKARPAEIAADLAAQDEGIKKAREQASRPQLVPVDTDQGTQTPIFAVGDRLVTIVDIDGVRQPFYLSTGRNPKMGVSGGQWLPFFGIGEDGWFNKGTEREIYDFYGSQKLRDVADYLDQSVGDIRESWEQYPQLGKSPQWMGNGQVTTPDVFAGLNPTSHREAHTSTNIQDQVARIEAAGQSTSKPQKNSEGVLRQPEKGTTPTPEKTEVGSPSQPEAYTYDEARDLLQQIKDVGSEKATNFSKGMQTRIERDEKAGRPYNPDFDRQKLEEFQQEAQQAGKPVEPQKVSLRDRVGGSDKYDAVTATEGPVKTALQEAEKAAQNALEAINKAGFKIENVNSGSPQQLRDLSSVISSISGTAQRLIGARYGVMKGYKNAKPVRVKEALEDLAKAVQLANDLAAGKPKPKMEEAPKPPLMGQRVQEWAQTRRRKPSALQQGQFRMGYERGFNGGSKPNGKYQPMVDGWNAGKADRDGTAPPPIDAQPTQSQKPRNMSLAEFIASKGGVRETGGELRARDLHKASMPPYGRVVRENGMTIDDAIQAAKEAGYYFDLANAKHGTDEQSQYGDEQVSHDRFLNDLADDAHRRKRRWTEEETARRQDKKPADKGEEQHYNERRREDRQAIIDAVVETGGSPNIPNDILDRAADMLARGETTDPLDALERATMQADEAEPAAHSAIEEVLPPGWDDEVHTGSASQNGAGLDAEGDENAGRGNKVPADATGAYAPGAGERGAGQAAEVDEFPTKPVEEIFPEPKETVSATKQAQAVGLISQEEANRRIESWKAAAQKAGQTQDNSRKVIISLFDRTGIWSQPWVDAGYHVVRYDRAAGHDLMERIPYADIQELREGGFEIYGVLSAPPCTSFAVSGAHSWKEQHDKPLPEWVEKKYGPDAAVYFDTPLDYAVTLARTVEVVVEIANPTHFHVLENPVGRIQKEVGLPKPTFSWNPNDFGDPYTKKTFLWGDFKTDLPLAPVEATKGSFIAKLYGGNAEQKAARSMTPEGFAYSFFMANHTPGRTITNRDDLWNPDHWEMMSVMEANRQEDLVTTPIRDAIKSGDFKKAQKLLDASKLEKEARDELQSVIDEELTPDEQPGETVTSIPEEGIEFHVTPEGQPKVPDLVKPGDRVRFTHGNPEGEIVKRVTGPVQGRINPYDENDHRLYPPSYSIILDHGRHEGALNEVVAVDGKLVKLFKSNDTSIEILDQSGAKGLTEDIVKQLQEIASGYRAAGKGQKAKAVEAMAKYPGRDLLANPGAEIERLQRDLDAIRRNPSGKQEIETAKGSPVNATELTNVKPEDTLVLMACGTAKAETKAPLHKLYTGSPWNILRTHRGAIPYRNIGVLSGKYGFITGNDQFPVLEPYDNKMTEAKADRLIERGIDALNDQHGAIKRETLGTSSVRGQLGIRERPYQAVIINGSGPYRRVFEAFVNQLKEVGAIAPDAQIVGTSGSILQMNSQLGQFLRQANAPAKVAEETGADNKPQLVIPGAEQVGQGQLAQIKSDQALKPKVPQKDTDGLALFNDSSKQGDIFDQQAKPEPAPKKIGTIPSEQVSILRAGGWKDEQIENSTPAEREAYINAAVNATKAMTVIEGPAKPGHYYLSVGEEGKHYTLRFQSASAITPSSHIVNLATNKDAALEQAKIHAFLRGATTIYDDAPDVTVTKERPGEAGTSSTTGTVSLKGEVSGKIEKNPADERAPTEETALPRPPEQLTDKDVVAKAGLTVTETTSKRGTKYWQITGNTQGNKAVLDAIGAKDPRQVNGKWTRSVFDGGNPTARLAAALRGEMPAKPEKPAPAVMPENGKELLGQAKLNVSKEGNGWIVGGQGTFTYKDIIKKAGGRWDGSKKGWRFQEDPSAAIAQALGADVGAGSPGAADAGDAGAGGNVPADKRLSELRQREDARTDERISDASSLVSESTKELIARGLQFGIPEQVVKDQIEDIGMAVNAFDRSKPMFLLANEAGTGKTFVLGGIIRELREKGVTKFVYVTQSEDLIEQIKRDLKAYGVDGVQFVTYAKMQSDPTDGVLIFDEAHNIKNVADGTQRATQGQSLMGEARFTVFASATPFQNPVEAAYLAGTGVFENAGGFNDWTKAYGAAVRKIKFRDQRGNTQTKEIVYWPPGGGKKKDGAAARQWFIRQGVMTQRAMKIDPTMVDVQFRRAEVTAQWVDLYDKVNAVYETALRSYQDENGNSRDSKITSEISRHRENAIKRVLEASKVANVIERAKELLGEGKNVVIFVETKAERTMGRWRRSEHFKDNTLYTYPQMVRLMAEWESEANAARAMRERPPPKPFADFIYELARHFHDANLTFDLPATANEIRDALGKENVGIYTGDVQPSAAKKAKEEFLAGKKKVLIATMAKGGTGLSLHDTVGNRPTVQLNINLPWAAWQVDQVAARVARYGLKSKAQVEWTFASNIPWETTKLAPRVGQRMRDMGAIVKGIEVNAAEKLTGDFDFEGVMDAKGGKAIDVEAKDDPVQDVYTLAQRLENSRRKAEDTSNGFFATPFPIAAFMTRISGIRPGERVLEPSAGHGNLLRFLDPAQPKTAIEERADNYAVLSSQLIGKNAETIHGDFMRQPPDAHDVVLMNPPFERQGGIGKDVLHVQFAYDNFLRPGGRLIAIMGEGPFFRDNRAEQSFREWLDDVGATVVRLPEGAFKNSGTGVRARMVIIDKDGTSGRSDIDLKDVNPDTLREMELSIPRRVNNSGPMLASMGPVKGFYSAIERFLATSKVQKAPAQDWLNLLRKAPGVKAEELAWTGLDMYLAGQKGQVTREDLLQVWRENQMPVEEKVRGEKAPISEQEIQKEIDEQFNAQVNAQIDAWIEDGVDHLNNWEGTVIKEDGKYMAYAVPMAQQPWNPDEDDRSARDVNAEWLGRFTTHEDALAHADRAAEEMNQRELDALRVSAGNFVNYDRIEERVRRDFEDARDDETETKFGGYIGPFEENPDSYRELLIKLPEDYFGNDYFVQRAHWTEANVLAFTRFDSRLVNGKRTMMVHEIQSDWHQQGRDKGYRDRAGMEGLEAAKNKIQRLQAEIVAANMPLTGIDDPDVRSAIIERIENKAWRWNKPGVGDRGDAGEYMLAIRQELIQAGANRSFIPLEQFARLYEARVEHYRLEQEQKAKVPDAPFKENWHELALKRILHWAAEHGYEAVALTTGKIQNEQWSLATHVDKIEYVTSPDEQPSWTGAPPRPLIRAYKNGKLLQDYYVENDELLAAQIGRAAARRLLEQTPTTNENGQLVRTLEGEDLSIGKQGMTEFYDKKAVSFLRKFAKRFGSDVEAAPMEARPDGHLVYQLLENGQNVGEFESYHEVYDEIRRRNEEDHFNENVTPPHRASHAYKKEIPQTEPVWFMPINEAMQRSAVGEGFPLFNVSGVKADAQGRMQHARQMVVDTIRQVVGDYVQIATPDTIAQVPDEVARRSGFTGNLDEAQVHGAATPIKYDDGTMDYLIEVAMAVTGTPVATAFHEAYHVLDMAGAFSAKEKKVLGNAVERFRRELIQRGYPRQSVQQMPSYEVLAYRAQEYHNDLQNEAGVHPLIRRIFDKVIEFLDRLRSAITGLGFQRAEDIFSGMAKGKYRNLQGRSPNVGEKGFKFASFGPQAKGMIEDVQNTLGTTRTPTTYTPPYNVREANFATQFRQHWIDRFAPMEAVQKAVEKVHGPIPEHLNVVDAARVYPGKLEARMTDFETTYIDPLTKMMKDEGITPDELGLYLLARHAQERNAAMAARDPSRFGADGGSGLFNAEATEIMNRLAPRQAVLDRAATLVDAMKNFHTNTLLSYGLISQQTANDWQNEYQFYVPLRGLAEDYRRDGLARTGKGFSIKGREVKQAFGRESLSDNPLFNMILQAEEGIVRTEQNEVGKVVLNFFRAYPHKGIAVLDFDPITGRPLFRPTIPIVSQMTGQRVDIDDDNFWFKDNVMGVKVGGRPYNVAFVTDAKATSGVGGELAQAFVNMDVPRSGLLLRSAALITRTFSRLQTSANLDFIAPNVLRDIPEALWTAHGVKNLAPKVAKLWPVALKHTAQHLAGKNTPEFDRWRRAGGKIAFQGLRGVEDIKQDIVRELETVSSQWTTPGGIAKRLNPIRLGDNTLRAFEHISEVFESATRLAVFMAAKEAGLSDRKAAILSREATVDFNRGGTRSHILGAWYPFFRASVAGADKMSRAVIQNKRMRAVFGSFVAVGFALTLWNLWMSGDDDAEKWRKAYLDIPEWQRMNYVIVKYGTGADQYFRLPMPFGLKLPYVIGEQLALTMFGQQKAGTSAWNVVKASVDAYNPLGQSATPIQAVTPLIGKPFVDLYLNKNFFGGSIYPETNRFQKGVPNFNLHNKSTPTLWVDLAEKLNSMSGGSKLKPGWINAKPDALKYMLDYVAGGLGRTVQGGVQGAIDFYKGNPIDWSKMPVARRFLPASKEQMENARYYELRQQAQEDANRFNFGKKANDNDTKEEARQVGKEIGVKTKGKRSSWDGTAIGAFREADTKVSKLREELRDTQRNQFLSPLERAAKVRDLQTQIAATQRDAKRKAMTRMKADDEPSPLLRSWLNR